MLHIDDPALVDAILDDPGRFGVRPPGQPAPPHLGDGALARTYGRWVRMRDDAGHAQAKEAIQVALGRLDRTHVERVAQEQSQMALPGGWDHWVWATSCATMAGLLGFGPHDLRAQRVLSGHLHAVARALAPNASRDQTSAGDLACSELLKDAERGPGVPLGLPDVADEVANRLALVWQSFDAGAALLGKALLRLAEEPPLRRPGEMEAWLERLVREEGVLLNTRRFARSDVRIGRDAVRRGDTIVVALARHGFGHGPHQCPGQGLALTIAGAALGTILRQPGIGWPAEWTFLNLPNANIPVFKESQR